MSIMRFFRHAATAALLVACLLGLSATAQAGHAERYKRHSATYVPRVDPYAYYYEQRGYYSNYHSGYWRPLREVRQTHRRRFHSRKGYRYKSSWGNPRARHRHTRKRFWFWHY